MMYYLFELKKDDSDTTDELLFSDEKYLWFKLPIKQFTLLSFTLPDQEFHYFFDRENVFTSFHSGDEFIAFLVAKGVTHVRYDLLKIDDTKTLTNQDGRELMLSCVWIPTGYEYAIFEKGVDQSLDLFQVPKSGKIELGKVDKPTVISLKHQGTSKDPIMQEAYNEMKSSKRYGCVFGIIFIILFIVAFYYAGQLLNWFGELLGIG